MSQADTHPSLAPAEPLAANIRSAQPGGGFCYRLELAWGRLRRAYLRRFRRGYVEKMARLREGDLAGAPHEILDPRDLKYCGALCQVRWPADADPFRWRERLPFARWGLAELMILGVPLLALAASLAMAGGLYRAVALVPLGLAVLLAGFFRDPPRRIARGPGLVVSPADGTVVDVSHLRDDPWVGGPAVRISIFLSLLDVHINRAPTGGRVVWLKYEPGEFLNALRADSAWRNESMSIAIEQQEPPYRRLLVRQISGLVARRIVCALGPGQRLERGEQFGMIKLGSRTELTLPAEGLSQLVARGTKVRAGISVLGRFETAGAAAGGGGSP